MHVCVVDKMLCNLFHQPLESWDTSETDLSTNIDSILFELIQSTCSPSGPGLPCFKRQDPNFSTISEFIFILLLQLQYE